MHFQFRANKDNDLITESSTLPAAMEALSYEGALLPITVDMSVDNGLHLYDADDDCY